MLAVSSHLPSTASTALRKSKFIDMQRFTPHFILAVLLSFCFQIAGAQAQKTLRLDYIFSGTDKTQTRCTVSMAGLAAL